MFHQALLKKILFLPEIKIVNVILLASFKTDENSVVVIQDLLVLQFRSNDLTRASILFNKHNWERLTTFIFLLQMIIFMTCYHQKKVHFYSCILFTLPWSPGLLTEINMYPPSPSQAIRQHVGIVTWYSTFVIYLHQFEGLVQNYCNYLILYIKKLQ